MGVGAAFPPVGLFGAWATNREKNKITARMQELGLEVPKDEGIFGNVISGIKNLFGMDQQAATAATARGAGTGAGAGTTRRADAGAGAGAAREVRPAAGLSRPAYETEKAPVSSGRGTVQATAPTTTPVSSGRGTIQATAPIKERGAATQRTERESARRQTGQTNSINKMVDKTIDDVKQAAINREVLKSIETGTSYEKMKEDVAKTKAAIDKEVKDSKIKEKLSDLSKGVKRGYNKGGLAARTK